MDKNKRLKIINAILDIVNLLLTLSLIKGFFKNTRK